jgi:hypothetical protein
MATWTTKQAHSEKVSASHINDLQTGKLDADGTQALTGNWNAGSFDIKATSFSVGSNTLTTSEFGYLDGQNQALKTTDSPTFASLGVTISGVGIASLSDELVTNGVFTSDLTGWTAGAGWSWSSGAKHTAGNTETFTQSITLVANTYYFVRVNASGATTGTLDMTLSTAVGTRAIANNGILGDNYFCFRPTSDGAATLTFTPSTGYNGTITSVSMKAVTGTISPSIREYNSLGANSFEHRSVGLPSGLLWDNPQAYAAGSVAIGYRAMEQQVAGFQNNGYGYETLTHNVSGAWNNAFGQGALYTNWSGTGNSAFGHAALQYTTVGSYNTAVGYNSLYLNTTGEYNCAFGYRAMVGNTTGYQNVAMGNEAMQGMTTGIRNVAVGPLAHRQPDDSYNTAIGYASLYTGGGDRNVAIGCYAGFYETGSDKLFIDNRARSSESDARVKSLIYGICAATTAAQSMTINANLGVGTSSFGTNADFVLSIATGTAPTTSPTDSFQLYSADFAAGNACPYFRTESGTVIGLNQSLTTTADVTFNKITIIDATDPELILHDGTPATYGMKIWHDTSEAHSYFDQYYDSADGRIFFRTRTTGTPRNSLVVSGNSNIGVSQLSWGTNASNTLAVSNGVAPSTSPADCFQLYSGDVGSAADNAGPLFRMEGGGVFGLRSDTGSTFQYVYQNDSLADDGSVSLPDATSGVCFVSCNAECGMWLVQNDGTCTKISGTANTVATDTDTNLCVFDGGTSATVRNRLGTTGEIRIIYFYN